MGSVDRFASLPEDVRRMRDGLRKAQRLSSYAGDGRLVYGVDDIDTVGELVSKLRPLGVYFGERSAPTPSDFGALIDYMERRDLKGARARWKKPLH